MEPTKEAREEAKLNPDGWVYAIDGLRYDPERPVPPEAIQGAWKVDQIAEVLGRHSWQAISTLGRSRRETSWYTETGCGTVQRPSNGKHLETEAGDLLAIDSHKEFSHG
ncbi:MAG: hypothetical protein KDB14_33840 [Planctomycetales bacterium]|nr:hypothetical protein [Planctomycetales bacterium]